MARRVKSLLKVGLTAGTLAVLTVGCSTILPGGDTASTLYGLTAPSNYTSAMSASGWQLMVEEPVAERALDTDRIAVYSGPHALQYFTGARWTDRAPRMMQDLIVESFEHAGLQMSASRQSVAVRPNVALVSDLRDFEARVTPAGDGAATAMVVVRLSAKVIWLDGRKVLDGRTFEARQAAGSDTVADVVSAMNVAAQSVVRDVVVWATETSNQAMPAS
ncbi:ABC-type transport auxiliary lipoprotein family protein [Pyruvatibacter sp.]